jgi:hypothetical protein
MALSDKDRDILDFEASWWNWPGPKARSIRTRLDVTPGAYYKRLSALVDSEDAKAHAPLVVLRLRRRRTERRKERLAGFAQPHPRP